MSNFRVVELIERNPENSLYYTGLEKALQLPTEQERLNIYEDVLSNKPYASMPKKLPLFFLTGQSL